MTNIEIIAKFNAGEMTLDEANAKLKGVKLNPEKNVLTEEEMRATTIGYYPDMANGYGLLDTGTGTLDKVTVENGKLKYGVGDIFALCIIGGKVYEVKNDTLVEG